MAAEHDAEHLRLHADLCKVLTDPKRLVLLASLRDGERAVGELADAIGSTLANTSQHLAVMRAAGLVEGSRTGTTVRYRLAEPAILEACAIVDGIVERRRLREQALERDSRSPAAVR
jgi:ArsR family transcriptional regulator